MAKKQSIDPAMMIMSQVQELDTSSYVEPEDPEKGLEAAQVQEEKPKTVKEPKKERQQGGRFLAKGVTMTIRRETGRKIRAAKLAVNLSSKKPITTSDLIDSLLDNYIKSFSKTTLTSYETILKMLTDNGV